MTPELLLASSYYQNCSETDLLGVHAGFDNPYEGDLRWKTFVAKSKYYVTRDIAGPLMQTFPAQFEQERHRNISLALAEFSRRWLGVRHREEEARIAALKHL
jgi:hypothetical protein